jgi:hypothetical protein
VVGGVGGAAGRDERRAERPAPPYTHPQVDATTFGGSLSFGFSRERK